MKSICYNDNAELIGELRQRYRIKKVTDWGQVYKRITVETSRKDAREIQRFLAKYYDMWVFVDTETWRWAHVTITFKTKEKPDDE